MSASGDDPMALPVLIDMCSEATDAFVEAVQGLDEAAMRGPSLLPGWDRAMLVSHVHRNAEALGRLIEWARTGTPTPMYASAEQRIADIAESAAWSSEHLRAATVGSAHDLATAFGALTPEQWETAVTTATGREVPATAVPWLRTREVAIHLVDLGLGHTFGDLPPDFLDALIDDVVRFRAGRGTDPACAVVDGHGEERRLNGRPGEGPTVTGDRAHLAAWLTGRSEGVGLDVDGPALPRLLAWL